MLGYQGLQHVSRVLLLEQTLWGKKLVIQPTAPAIHWNIVCDSAKIRIWKSTLPAALIIIFIL